MTIHPADERPMDTTHPLATSRTHAFHAERHARLELERLLGVVEAFCDPGVRPTFRQLVEAAFRARHAVNDANRATWEVIADGLAAEAAYRARCDAAATRDAWDVVADGIAAAAEATDTGEPFDLGISGEER